MMLSLSLENRGVCVGGGGGEYSAAQRHTNIMNVFQTHSELLTNFIFLGIVHWKNNTCTLT